MNYGGQVPGQVTQVNPIALLDGLLQASQLVRMRLNDWLGNFDLNDGRLAVLVTLSKATDVGCSQAELAEQLGQSASNISTLIERMARDGLVSRLRSDADRRKRVLSITSAGSLKLASVDTNRFAWSAQILSGIPAGDQPKLFAMLQQLGSHLESSFTILATTASAPPTSTEAMPEPACAQRDDLANDPQSPQFALRQMLLAMSSSSGVESNDEKEAA